MSTKSFTDGYDNNLIYWMLLFLIFMFYGDINKNKRKE